MAMHYTCPGILKNVIESFQKWLLKIISVSVVYDHEGHSTLQYLLVISKTEFSKFLKERLTKRKTL